MSPGTRPDPGAGPPAAGPPPNPAAGGPDPAAGVASPAAAGTSPVDHPGSPAGGAPGPAAGGTGRAGGAGSAAGAAGPYDAWMRQALSVAAGAVESGDVPVGAVVVSPSGSILAAAANARERDNDPTAHAELLALRAAAAALGTWRLEGCTLVVTLEPCTMCAGALVLARVSRLVYGPPDPKAGAVGSLWDVVRDRRLNSRPEVVAGVLAVESAVLLRSFFATRRTRSGP